MEGNGFAVEWSVTNPDQVAWRPTLEFRPLNQIAQFGITESVELAQQRWDCGRRWSTSEKR